MAAAVACTPSIVADPAEGDAPDAAMDNGKLLRVMRPIADQYNVVFFDDEVAADDVTEVSDQLVQRHGGDILGRYQHALRGFSATMTEEQALRLSVDPRVAFVEEDGEVEAAATQVNPPWGLDRIDRAVPGWDGYHYSSTGAGVNVYIIDSGIRTTHSEFEGRASLVFSSIDDEYGLADCAGHGTHVAGIVGGKTSGVAKGAKLLSVRVLGCGGNGPTSGVIAGVDWVTAHRVLPAVANLSINSGNSVAMDAAVNNSIASGVTYTASAGNQDINACTNSPARVPAAITVAGSNSSDGRYSASSWGPCVDLFAPGQSILSAGIASDSAFATWSGTSMAAPHVAGAAAQYLQYHPGALPAEVAAHLVAIATPNAITNPGEGSPNRLLHSPEDVAGPVGSVVINGGAAVTSSSEVSLTLVATDASGVKFMRLSGDGVAFTPWVAYTSVASFTLAGGAGPRSVYAQFRDSLGLVSGIVRDEISAGCPAGTYIGDGGLCFAVPQECFIGGGMAQVCANEALFGTRQFDPEAVCYQIAVCERQVDGACGWTVTPELTQCLAVH
jgi:subtilisin family serine protease